jgi:hypothetical protein
MFGLNGIILVQTVDINFKMFSDNKFTGILILKNLQTPAEVTNIKIVDF